MPWNRVLAAGGAAGLAALAGRYAAGLARADRSWPGQIEARLSDLGEVDEVSILPLVERLTPDGSGLTGEPGVSYLIRAGGMRVLFDSGLSGGKAESALVHNAQMLGAPLGRPYVIFYSGVVGADLGFCCLIGPGGDPRSWLRWLRCVEAERDRLAEQLEYAALFRGRC
jgi:hypothetical protein